MTPSASPPRRPPHLPRSTTPSSARPALAQIATLLSTRHTRADLNPTSVSQAPLPGTNAVATPRTPPLPPIVPRVVIELLRPENL